MIRLRQLHGAHTGREVEFDDVIIKIGRLPGSDVAFDPHADRDASGLHAELHRTATGYRVVDQKSRNGTWVNGERITQHDLRVGDEIECGFGGPRLRVESMSGTSFPSTVPTGSAPLELDAPSQPQENEGPPGRGLLIAGVILTILGLGSIIAVFLSI